MSLQLPQFPNLEYLRKQSKTLHRKMGQGKLADAQQTLVQAYGFATREVLLFHPTLELKSREYPGTALSCAIFGSGNGWNRQSDDYVGTICALLEAGAATPPNAEALEPSDAVLEVLP